MAQAERIELLTTTRDDLVSIAGTLALAIDPAFMEERYRPLIVSVMGSLQSGKKIFPDIMREAIIGSTALCRFSGRTGYDEFWQGAINNRAVEIFYVDAMWGSGYANKKLENFHPAGVRSAFLMAQRQAGGISFVQNDDTLSQNAMSGMDIWVEKQGASCLHGSRLKKSPLQEKFEDARKKAYAETGSDEWVRFVQLTVRDKRLLESQRFMKSFKWLSPHK